MEMHVTLFIYSMPKFRKGRESLKVALHAFVCLKFHMLSFERPEKRVVCLEDGIQIERIL